MTDSWVVLKFGGTSVSSAERWEIIRGIATGRRDEGLRPLLVCSAFSQVSNMLEAVIAAAVGGQHEEKVAAVVARHRELAEQLGVSTELISSELATLEQLALGISLVGEVSPRVHARIMALGELMSTKLGVRVLQQAGVKAAWVDARDCLQSIPQPLASENRNHLSATCHHQADPELAERLGAVNADVLVTQGFIARSEEGHTVLLGRGGSDTSAAYFAARLGAARCEIWTDVPGMFTANPRDIVNARLLKMLDYDEAQELATAGAKVLHPRCIAPVREHGIPLHVRCTPNPDLDGTVVREADSDQAQVKAVSSKDNITLVSMDTLGMWQQVGFLANVFKEFAAHGLSVDLVSTSESNVTVTLDPAANNLEPRVMNGLLADLGRHCRARVIDSCAAISLVGRKIRRIFHELGPALEVFEEQRIHLVSQAASDLNVTFVVDQSQARRLVKRLHVELFEGKGKSGVFGPSWGELFEQEDAGETDVPVRDVWWVNRATELEAIARQDGPSYVYDANTLQKRATSLTSLDAVNRVFYAMKANNHPDVLQVFHGLGLGFECVSPGELARIRELFPKLSADRILFTPNFAPASEYEAALQMGVNVTVDNLFVLEQWPEIFRGQKLFVRLDPGRGKGHHSYVRTAGKQSKFGVAPEQVERLQELVEELAIEVVGLHAHAGSGIRTPGQWSDMGLFLASAARKFSGVRYLNLGGGLGVPEKPGQEPLDIGLVGESLAAFKAANPGYEVWLEPGRFLVAESGVLVANVTQIKTKGDVLYVGLDTGMNSLIRPALYGAFHEIVNLSRMGEPRTQVVNVVGPICETGDTLGYGRRLPETRAGDVFLIGTAGAYGRTMSSHYNLREPAAEVVLDPAS